MRILDGDDGLVCKGLHQGYLIRREWLHLVPIDNDHSQQLTGRQHGNGKHSAIRVYLLSSVGILGVSQDIMNMDGPSLKCCAPRGGLTAGHKRIAFKERYMLG